MNTFLAAFLDEMEKIAKEAEKEDTRDSTERSVHRGAGIGAAGLGALGAIRGGVGAARTNVPYPKLTEMIPAEKLRKMTPHERKLVRKSVRITRRGIRGSLVAGGALGGGVAGALKGALYGGALGFLLRGKKKDADKTEK
jgi:hypothetical protein